MMLLYGKKKYFKKDFFLSFSIIIIGVVIIKENGEILMDVGFYFSKNLK